MQQFQPHFHIDVNETIFVKDPESSALGKKIVSGAIDLMEKDGFESFTFKKLSAAIGSTEASIYRYFENKNKLLLYLTSWYWTWQEARVQYAINNIDDVEEKLEVVIKVLTEEINKDSSYSHIDEVKLQRIVYSESPKSILTKDVDEYNKTGVFESYKRLVCFISEIILCINPEFGYAKMLVSTILDSALHQRFFAAHIPSVTNQSEGEDIVQAFYTSLVLKVIKN
ncbi:MAG: TetR/AcrR family transcriptional regulator [Crocinitomicaceae bacterium]|nr:TetR/AcrR family transcriptional regulator [Crocinitomicaceae bacterium]